MLQGGGQFEWSACITIDRWMDAASPYLYTPGCTFWLKEEEGARKNGFEIYLVQREREREGERRR